MLGIENVVELSRAPKRRNAYFAVFLGRGAPGSDRNVLGGELLLRKLTATGKSTKRSEGTVDVQPLAKTRKLVFTGVQLCSY